MAKGKCEYCKKNLVSQGIKENIHHIVGFASRGSDAYHNLIVLCPDCHSRVHNDQISKEELRAKISYRLPKRALVDNTAKETVKAKRTTAKKATATTTTSKKTAIKKTAATKTTPKKTTVKKAPATKTTLRKTTAKKRAK